MRIRRPEDCEFKSASSGADPGAGIAIVAVASCDENRSVAVLNHVATSKPEPGAPALGFHDGAGIFLVDELGGELSEFLFLIVGYHAAKSAGVRES